MTSRERRQAFPTDQSLVSRSRRRIVTKPLLQRNRAGPYLGGGNGNEEGEPMSRRTQAEAEQQHLLLIVESAQRAGLSEDEIGEIVTDALEADVERERAA